MASGTHEGPKPNSEQKSWSPRMWLGCDFFSWLRIMARGQFRFDLPYVHMGVITSIVSAGHSILKCAQNARYRTEISRTKIEKAPVFIIGHWRTGTTLLHEMLILDRRHTYPNTYQCLVPNHFLLSEKLLKRWLWFMLPKHRPMDNMEVGWDRPQEDEFAMCMLGQPSPYLDLVFPNGPPLEPGSLDLEGLTPSRRTSWKRSFYRFLQALTLRDPRRLILKSPPHSCRIPTLLELFPDARFVHIMRNPYTVYSSTMKLWKSLALKHGVQNPNHKSVEEKVLSTFTHLYEKLEEGKKLVRPGRFYELKYEDLIVDPMSEIEKLYDCLGLGGFDDVRKQLVDFLARNANYETNKFQLDPEKQALITQRWGKVISQYGYPLVSTGRYAPRLFQPQPSETTQSTEMPYFGQDKKPDLRRVA